MSHVDLAPTRRTLVTQAGMLATVAGTANGMALASAFGANLSPIEAAYQRYVELAKAVDKTCGPIDEAEARYQAPPQPPYNHFRSQGGYDIEFTNPERTKGRSFVKVDDDNVERLKAIIASPFDPSQSEPMSVEWDRQNHEQRIQQAKVTLEQVEEWQAENKRRREASGLTAAEAAYDDAYYAMKDQIDVLLAMRPTNLQELALMALVAEHHEGDEGAVKIVEMLTNLAGVTPYYKIPQQDAA